MKRACDCEVTQIPLPIEEKGSYMSVQGLQSMVEHAQMLLGVINRSTPLPDWVESKIIRAAADITDVVEYYSHGEGVTKFSAKEYSVRVSLSYARKANEAFQDGFRREGHWGPGTDHWTFKDEEDASDFVEMLVMYWDIPEDEIFKTWEDRGSRLASPKGLRG